jgi:SAM-dependent methyltransferase
MRTPISGDGAAAFADRAWADLVAAMTVRMCSVGDRLGLFKELAAKGPATSAELACRTGIDERYAREWAAGMACAGYLSYDPATARFALPPEHASVLADEGDSQFLGGSYEAFPATLLAFEAIVRACRSGGGVPFSAYGDHMWSGLARWTAGWVEDLLVPKVLPALPHVSRLLREGSMVADIGAGAGEGLIRLARAFPSSRYVGYDVFSDNVRRANERAVEAGVHERVRFVERDITDGLPEPYDLIMAFDVVHDLPLPRLALESIRAGLTPGGSFLLLEHNCSDKLEDNLGAFGTLLYSSSLFYCLPTSMHQGGEGLGAAGLTESRVRELSSEAGFATIVRLAVNHAGIAVYEARA